MSAPPVSGRLHELLHPTITFRGAPRSFALRMPTVDEVLASLSESEAPGEARVQSLCLSAVLATVDAIDGEEAGYDEATAIVSDRDALAGVLGARNALFEVVREAGALHALCPHCRSEERALDLFTLVAALKHGPWPIVHANRIVLAAPSLAGIWPIGVRPPGVATTARLRFELPCARLGVDTPFTSGVLGDLDLDGDREVDAWKRWAPRGVKQPEERSAWAYQFPGFRALLRLAISLESLAGVDDEITPATLEPMAMPDFLFLDAAYHLTHNVDLAADSSLIQPCRACGGVFAPVRGRHQPIERIGDVQIVPLR